MKIAILKSHAIQYEVPLFRRLEAENDIDLTVYFSWDFGAKETYDPEFGKKVKWDTPLLGGYRHVFLKNISPRPSSNFWGQINPGVAREIWKGAYGAIIISGWNSFTNWLAFLTALLRKTPVYWHGESPLNQELLKTGWKQTMKKIVLRRVFEKSRGVLCIGLENKKFYASYGVPEEKMHFVPYAVDNANFMVQRRKHKGRPAALFVGKLIPKKRVFDILEALRILKKGDMSRELLPALSLVGEGALRKEMEEYVRRNSLEHVRFAGFQNQKELPNWYAESDIFILPSGAGETWGLVVNEAMCAGLPVVVSDMAGCAADLVRHGKNGFVFPCGNAERLAEYVRRLAENEEERRAFGEESKKIIREYSHEKDVEGIRKALGLSGKK